MRQLPFEYALRNLGRSRLRLAALLTGGVLVTLLGLTAGGFVRGMQRTLVQPEPLHENVIILGAGSEEAIERSQIGAAVEGILAASVRQVRAVGPVALVSPEIHAALPVKADAASAVELPAVMRGVTERALLVHPQVELTAGRWPGPGADELLVGALAHVRLGVQAARLEVGQTLYFHGRDWTIVGRFQAPGSVQEAEIWLPLTDLQIATRREASLSCVIVSVEPGGYGELDLLAKSRLDLEIAAVREADYYRGLARFYQPIRLLVVVTATLVALGGILGGLNTMYAAFAARVREVGMLQALGFSRRAVVLSLTEESVFAASIGALVGLVLGRWLLSDVAVRFSMGAFALVLDAPVQLAAVGSALLVGVIGAVPPALRCLRLPITEALKSF